MDPIEVEHPHVNLLHRFPLGTYVAQAWKGAMNYSPFTFSK